MTKMEREYAKEFGDVPKTFRACIDYILKDANLKKYQLHVYEEIKRIHRIKWKTVRYTIYLLPKATPRPRRSKSGIFYVSGAADNKKFFEENFVNDEDIPLITTPTRFKGWFYLPIPKSMHPVEKILAEMGFIYPVSKPDWDNLAKAYCDMIQGLLLYDDSLVVDGESHKRYSVKPRIEIEISYMEDYDSNFNRSKILKKGGKK